MPEFLLNSCPIFTQIVKLKDFIGHNLSSDPRNGFLVDFHKIKKSLHEIKMSDMDATKS